MVKLMENPPKHLLKPSHHRNESPIAITEDGKKVFALNNKGEPVCNGRKKDGNRCGSTLTLTNGRCRMHGGKAPAGVTHYKSKTLRSSDSMPHHLKGDMIRALNDPDQLNLKHEIALLDTLVEQQKAALETGLGAAAWKKLFALADKLEFSLEEDPENSEKICKEVISVIRSGVKEREVWKEIDSTVESRRRLVETASRREIQLRTMLKGDQAIALVTGMAAAARGSISKTINQIETNYTIKDKATDKVLQRLPGSVKSDFLGDVSIQLGKLIASNSNPSNDVREEDYENQAMSETPEGKQKASKEAKAKIEEDMLKEELEIIDADFKEEKD